MLKPVRLTNLCWGMAAALALSCWTAIASADHKPDGSGGPSAEFPPDGAPVAEASTQRRVQVETESFSAVVSERNGGLVSFALKDARYQREGKPLDMVSTDRAEFFPLSFELGGVDFGDSPEWTTEQLGKAKARLRWSGDGVTVTRTYQAGTGPYQLWVTTSVQNRGSDPRTLQLTTQVFHYVPRTDEEGGLPLVPVRSPWTSHGLCYHGDGDLAREDRGSLTKEPHRFDKVSYAGIENVYFLAAVAVGDGPGERCILSASDRGRDAEGDPLGTLFNSAMASAPQTAAPGESAVFRTLAYLGPKTPDTLSQAGHGLRESIDGGFFGALSRLLTMLLRKIHDLIGNWGVAIILLTLIVKVVLFPLTAKQMKSMARMKELKPDMDRINQLYANDREKKGAAIMELHREKGVNPMAGCLPMLVQLPIWISLYSSLSTNIELFHAPFALWLTDLSSPDEYFVLPLALGLLMYLQQRITPTSGMDPVQQKMMMYMMPSMMMAFMLFLPAGLCLYMFTNSALSIGQQKLIEAQLAKAPSKASSEESVPPPSASTPLPATGASTGETPRRPHRSARPSKAERRSRRGK